MGFEFMYFLMVHIDFSSAASTNSFQVLCFTCLTFWLYSLRFFFHSSQSMLLPVLLCRFLTWFSSFLNFVSFSLHHLLLKGDGCLRGAFSFVSVHITILIVSCPLPHTMSIAVFPSRNVIVPGGISSCIPCWSIPSINSSACWSCL